MYYNEKKYLEVLLFELATRTTLLIGYDIFFTASIPWAICMSINVIVYYFGIYWAYVRYLVIDVSVYTSFPTWFYYWVSHLS